MAKKKTGKKKVTKKKVKSAKKVSSKKKQKKVSKKKAKKKTTVKKRATKGLAQKRVKKKTVKSSAGNKVEMKYESDLLIPVSKVALGEKIPEFSLEATGQQTVKLPNTKRTVLFFYPKDSTPGCTIEGQDFTRLHSAFAEEGVEVYGVSRDSIKSHENFKTKQNYSVDLLSDSNEEACSIFGVIKLKNMYGKKVRGIDRSTFVLAVDGTLEKEWRGVKVPGHAEEVLKFIKES